MDKKYQNRRAFIGSIAKGGALLGGAVGLGRLGLNLGQAKQATQSTNQELGNAVLGGNQLGAAKILVNDGFDISQPICGRYGDRALPIELAIMEVSPRLVAYFREEEEKKAILRDLTFCAPGRLSLGQMDRGSAQDRFELASMLVGYGVNLGARSAFGHQALHWALRENHWEVAEVLIEAGAPVNDSDGLGKTPLMLATDSPEFVKYLIQNNARVDIGSLPDKLLVKGRDVRDKLVQLILG
ncbi:ankyrin repeat domain-containing protein [Bdellovibrionota bacterium FG-1]